MEACAFSDGAASRERPSPALRSRNTLRSASRSAHARPEPSSRCGLSGTRNGSEEEVERRAGEGVDPADEDEVAIPGAGDPVAGRREPGDDVTGRPDRLRTVATGRTPVSGRTRISTSRSACPSGSRTVPDRNPLGVPCAATEAGASPARRAPRQGEKRRAQAFDTTLTSPDEPS